jgi:hypothetical protein
VKVYLDKAGRPLPSDEQEKLRQRQLEDDALIDATQRDRKKALANIARFKEQQLLRRDWIAICDVVDWRSRDRAIGVEREDYRLAALRDIDLAIRTRRHFFENGQSRILLTFPLEDVPESLIEHPLALPQQYWLSQAYWLAQHELASPQPDETEAAKLERLFKSVLQWAWIPRELCLHWSDNVPFEPRPEWFTEISSTTIARVQPAQPRTKRKSRGKKPGQGSYSALDAPRLLEMKQLLSQGKAASVEEAARQVASRAHGFGTVESKAERLARRFRRDEAEQAPRE